MPRYHCLPKNPSVVIVAGENTSLLPRDDVAVALAATKIRQKTATRARGPSIFVSGFLLLLALLLFVTTTQMTDNDDVKNDALSALRALLLHSAGAIVGGCCGSATTNNGGGGGSIFVPPVVVSARLDPKLTCTVVGCTDMVDTGGPDATTDRTGHLRAARSMQWITDSRLAIVQDDSNFVALVDVDLDDEQGLRIKDAYSIALPSSTSRGDRQFQKSRANTDRKLDLEASIYVPKEHSPLEDGFLLGLGSGSSYYRNVIIMVRDSLLHAASHISVDFQAVNTTYWSHYCAKDIAKPIGGTSPLVAFYAPSLYEALRRRSDFSGSELNIEGAAFIVPSSREAAKIRFFQRGNGAADTARGLSPKSSTAEIVAEDVSDTQFGRFCCC